MKKISLRHAASLVVLGGLKCITDLEAAPCKGASLPDVPCKC